jgi:hypothetical protein
VSLWNGLWPPVGGSYVDHVISHVAVQVCLLGIGLITLSPFAAASANSNLASAALSTGAYRSVSLRLTPAICWSPLRTYAP